MLPVRYMTVFFLSRVKSSGIIYGKYMQNIMCWPDSDPIEMNFFLDCKIIAHCILHSFNSAAEMCRLL